MSEQAAATAPATLVRATGITAASPYLFSSPAPTATQVSTTRRRRL